MDQIELSLPDHLREAAQAWCRAHDDAKPARLGRLALGDSAFFNHDAQKGPTTATLEKFAAFFADAGNWPDGCAIPEAVCGFIHRVEGRMPACCVATGMRERISR